MEPNQTDKQKSDQDADQAKKERVTALLGVYQEICKSHGAIDEFRMKLLGLLPLASLTGIFFVSKSDTILGNAASADSKRLIAFISVFAATFTLALFLYEIRGILMCTELICRGCAIENLLNVVGQFSARREGHQKWPFINAISTACVIYSVVFAGWLFLALHRGFDVNIQHCVLTALMAGIGLAIMMALLVNSLVKGIHKSEKKIVATMKATSQAVFAAQE